MGRFGFATKQASPFPARSHDLIGPFQFGSKPKRAISPKMDRTNSKERKERPPKRKKESDQIATRPKRLKDNEKKAIAIKSAQEVP